MEAKLLAFAQTAKSKSMPHFTLLSFLFFSTSFQNLPKCFKNSQSIKHGNEWLMYVFVVTGN